MEKDEENTKTLEMTENKENKTCCICEKSKFYLRLLKCCQTNSESGYSICRICMKKCDKCPLCRSAKLLTKNQIKNTIDAFYFDHWLKGNMHLALHIFLFSRFLEEPIFYHYIELWLDDFDNETYFMDMPPETNISILEVDVETLNEFTDRSDDSDSNYSYLDTYLN